jgi:hypothetical protein
MPLIINQPLLICYLIFSFTAPMLPESNKRHPFHLSSTELNYNAKESTVELSCRIFTDDLEGALAKKFKIKADLSAESQHKAMDVFVKKYALANLALKGNSKALALNYLGFEKDNEAIVVYLESAQIKGLKKLETTNSILYDQYDDQSNIIHVTKNGKRKSSKLDYPDKKLLTDF